jgi:selenocysteine lyase/cysteine desulfurase
MPTAVLDAITAHLRLEAEIGGYEAADACAEAIGQAYAAVGELIGAPPENVAMTENATAAFVQALSSVPFAPGDILLTTQNDYVSNQIMYLSLASRTAIEVVRAPESPEGGVDVGALEGLIHRRRPKLVAVTHVPTSSGLVQDVAEVGRICRDREVLFLLDACQSVGQMPIDVMDIGCDFLSATARKFLRGPRGCGLLYVSDRVLDMGLEPLFPDMRGADWIEAELYQPAPTAQRFENWEFPYALLLGQGAAARYALDIGIERIQERSWALAAELRSRLREIDGVRVLDRGAVQCAIVTAAFERIDAPTVVAGLAEAGINTSLTSRNSAVIDFDEKGVEDAVRFSPHYFNTESEIDAASETTAGLVA